MPERDPRTTERDALLLKLSALLDGELSADDEAAVFDAMSQDSALLAAFEAMAAARLPADLDLDRERDRDRDRGRERDLERGASLSGDEADELVAAVMAEAAPAEVPDSAAGALLLAHRFVDDDLDGAIGEQARARLFSLLDEKPALASPVAGFVASAAATAAVTRAVADAAGVPEALRHVADHVDAAVASWERASVLASAALDDALTPSELSELHVSLEGGPDVAGDFARAVCAFAAVAHVGEYLRATSTSTSFAAAAQRAGDAALHAIDAERLASERERDALAAKTSAPAAPAPSDSLAVRLWRLFAPARVPLAFGVAAAMVFFVVSGPTTPNAPLTGDLKGNRTADAAEIVNAIAPTLLAQNDKPAGELPLLADNDADVEALDTEGSTAVFSTDAEHITVIWVDTGT